MKVLRNPLINEVFHRLEKVDVFDDHQIEQMIYLSNTNNLTASMAVCCHNPLKERLCLDNK